MSGCLLRLMLLPLCVAVLYPLLCLRAPFPAIVIDAQGAGAVAGVTGIFTWWVIISWLDMRAIASKLALALDWQLRDGQRAVIAGYVKERGRTLAAPFTGERCVGYRYRVTHYACPDNMKTTDWADFEGFALVPCLIRGPAKSTVAKTGRVPRLIWNRQTSAKSVPAAWRTSARG